MKRRLVNPRPLPATPAGTRYSHLAIVEARRLLWISGQIAVGRDDRVIGVGDFDRQFHQVYRYLGAALRSQGASWSDVAFLRTFLVDARDLPRFHALRARLFRKLFPRRDYPASTLVVVSRLVHEELMIEVEALAALG